VVEQSIIITVNSSSLYITVLILPLIFNKYVPTLLMSDVYIIALSATIVNIVGSATESSD
jgi:hypothetical protein